MTEEKIVSGEVDSVSDTSADFIAAINELKRNSVDRSKYDELRAQNKQLLDSIVNGQEIEKPETKVVPTKEDIQAMRNELFNEEHNNLDYVSRALELREALMLNGEPDPFLPMGKQISPTREDEEIAAKVAQVYKECVDYAEGDSEVFTNELMRRTKDVRIR